MPKDSFWNIQDQKLCSIEDENYGGRLSAGMDVVKKVSGRQRRRSLWRWSARGHGWWRRWVNVKQGKGYEEGEWTSTKTKKVKLGWGCEEGGNVNVDEEGAKLG